MWKAAYYDQGELDSIQYLFNLEIASQAAAADAVICDAKGNILTCSRDPLGCTHRGLTINGALFDRAMRMGHSTDTGVLPGLYEENRYVCAQAIYSGKQAVGLVLVSTPTAQTMAVLDRIRSLGGPCLSQAVPCHSASLCPQPCTSVLGPGGTHRSPSLCLLT